jgi:hypothetical protein
LSILNRSVPHASSPIESWRLVLRSLVEHLINV